MDTLAKKQETPLHTQCALSIRDLNFCQYQIQTQIKTQYNNVNFPIYASRLLPLSHKSRKKIFKIHIFQIEIELFNQKPEQKIVTSP